MTREQLEHIIRAAGAILGEDEVIVIGSQAILAAFPEGLPADATESVEADILPLRDPDGRKADLIDGSIGEASAFHDAFSIYADGVGIETARLPAGWRERLIAVSGENTHGVVGRCLEPHDLLISKYLAGRPKDLRFSRAVVRAGLVKREVLLRRLRATACSPPERGLMAERIAEDFAGAGT